MSFAIAVACAARADILVLNDGRVASNCYVCDRGVDLWYWPSLQAVQRPPRAIPANKVVSFTIDRSAPAWDKKPFLPDLSVTHISRCPRLPGLHMHVAYDQYGAAFIPPDKTALVARTAFAYSPGQIITLTAHVRNTGFVPAKPFRFTWKLDGKRAAGGEYPERLAPMQDATFHFSFAWHTDPVVEFIVHVGEPEIVVWNNYYKDYTYGDDFFYIVSKGCVNAWHQFRSLQGAFSFEDFYRWHIDVMNNLLAASVYPATPSGCLERVRLDRIIYADDIEQAKRARIAPDGFCYDQGGWIWEDVETGKSHVPIATRNPDNSWNPPSKEWRNQVEWSMPHELGHQLGLIDWYNFDHAGSPAHAAPDTGDFITHFMDHPYTMMHWHGPHPYSEVEAAYLSMTRDNPRGFFGDHVFAMPRTNLILVLDINNEPLSGARVELYQRGVEIDTNAAPLQLDGATVFPVIEDGTFDKPVSGRPVAVGHTDARGIMMLPNRPATYVRTFNGIERHNNPLGNVNVVGGRGLLLIKVLHAGAPYYFWLDSYNFNVAWFRGARDKHTFVLKTPCGSADSPPAPLQLRATHAGGSLFDISWQPPPQRSKHYHDRIIGYRVYRRTGNDGLNDRPWYPVATLPATAHTARVDVAIRPAELDVFIKRERGDDTALGEGGRESTLISVVLD